MDRRSERGTRGAAALELALGLPLMLALAVGMLDYGFHMYVSVVTNQAAREGARELARIAVGPCGVSAPVASAATMAEGSGGAATRYVRSELGEGPRVRVSAACVTAPSNPSWRVGVEVEYEPVLGFTYAAGLLPQGSTAGYAQVSAQLVMRGR